MKIIEREAFGNKQGFTLVELLVVISIIGFLTVASVVAFNMVRMQSRDAIRVANIATINRALAMYLNDSFTGYPTSTGECLSGDSGVGAELKAAEMIIKVSTDPLWEAEEPNPDIYGDTDGFCYHYASNNKDEYQLSYYLESNSKSGDAGAHIFVP